MRIRSANQIKPVSTILLVVFLLLYPIPKAVAFETDQYNLPPAPLADIGDEITDHVIGQIRLAADDVNRQIETSEACLVSRNKGCGRADSVRKELDHLRSEEALAHAVYERLSGGNLMTTKFGKWMHGHTFRAQPASYKAPYRESIYLIKPSNYLTLSPTIHMYGHEFGIDKLEHLFQQGHQYYDRVKKELIRGKTNGEAVRKAIEWGKRTERTYYGILTSGVYSNADLFANYVGLKFYQGLTRSIDINGVARPAMLRLDRGLWVAIDDTTMRKHLLRPFITDHMNEAFNPSAFRFTLEGSVRRSVKRNSCDDWRAALPGRTAEAFKKRASELELWNGEDYGHTKRGGFVNIGEICFEPASGHV